MNRRYFIKLLPALGILTQIPVSARPKTVKFETKFFTSHWTRDGSVVFYFDGISLVLIRNHTPFLIKYGKKIELKKVWFTIEPGRKDLLSLRGIKKGELYVLTANSRATLVGEYELA